MDEPKTTTDEPISEGVEESTQPEVVEQPEAATESDVKDDQQDSTEPSKDDNSEWLKSKGIDPSDPDAASKLAKMYREAERAMHAKSKKASELEKSMESQVQQEAELQGFDDNDRLKLYKMEVKQAVRDFWDENPDAKQYEKQMIEVLQDNPHLAGDLEALYGKALLKGGVLESSKSAGGKEALDRLASKQKATAPTGSAVSGSIPSQKITRDVLRQKTEAGDVAWLDKNQNEINRLVSEGLL